MARRLLINAAMSVAQVVVVGAVYFVLYRFLLDEVGVEVLGIWSVVLATTNVGRLSNLGLNASVVKFVAQYLARGDRKAAVAVMETAAVALVVVMGALLLALYPLAKVALGWFIEPQHMPDALALLPWALASLLLSVLSGVFQSGLDGLERIDLRSILMMVGSLGYLALCWLLVPTHGIMGLAYAQLAQVGGLLLANAVLLKRLLPEMPLVPWRFQRSLVRELVGYGVNVQVMTVGSLLLEPLAKGLVSRYGGVAMAGYFEMANRMVIQLRQLINGAAQAMVPTVASRQETDQAGVSRLYAESYRSVFFVIFPALAGTMAIIPLVSELWIGSYQPDFVRYALLLTAGLYLGMLSSPAFFTNLGTGRLRWNTIATLVMLAVTALPSLATGGAFGPEGVVASYAAAFVVGGALILGGFHVDSRLGTRSLVPRESLPILMAAIPAAALPLWLYYALRPSLPLAAVGAAALGLFFLVLAWPLWRHPMRARVMGLARRLRGARERTV